MINLEELRKALEGASDGPWEGHNMTGEDGKQMTPEEIGEYVCNSVKMGATDRFLFVSGKHADGNDCDVCHTGNGPKGPHNTALIAQSPALAAFTLEAVEVLKEIIDANESSTSDAADYYTQVVASKARALLLERTEEGSRQ